MKKTLQDYKSSIPAVWCPGCGDYGVLRSLQKAFVNLELEPENIGVVSGIGCSGRFSHYLNTYSLHGTHGRAVPTAAGLKAARPDLTVLCVGGDGDGLGIGGGHISHTARKNVDITYILIDNQIYGLTKGQTSPTTPLDYRTKTNPYGSYETPMEALPIFLAYDISFIARTSPARMEEMTDIFTKAISHKGFSLVYVLSPCVTFPLMEFKKLQEILQPLPEDYDKTDKMKAMQAAYSKSPVYTGIFYEIQRKSLNDHLNAQVQKACARKTDGSRFTVKQMLESYT